MSRRKADLPILIGKDLKKGILAMRGKFLKGYDLWIVWLKKHYESGEKYAIEDIDKVNAVLHFCDRESIEQTIKVLKWMLKNGLWED